jgi:hypothetical protein
MRHLSFMLTKSQVRARTKDVTRRNGWATAQAGQVVMAIEQGQGLKKGQTVVKLGPIQFTHVDREPLRALTDDLEYGRREVIREGFPDLTPAEFVAMYCRHNGCTPETVVTRLAFSYLD